MEISAPRLIVTMGGIFVAPGRDIDHLPGLQHDSQLGIRRKIDEDLAA